MSTVLDAALSYAARNLPVFPVRGKEPLTTHGFKDAVTHEPTIRAWFGRWPDAGIATPCGPGWFVLDADDEPVLKALEAEHGPLPPTVEVVTPRPGRHIYLRGEATNATGSLPDGIHIRGVGGYVLLPPSPHPNGGRYEWRTVLGELDMAQAPAWLLELLRPASSNGSAPTVDGDIPDQQRNETLASLAGTMRRRGFHEAAIEAALLVTNRDRCRPPLGEPEVRRVARSVARYKPADDAVASLDELTVLLGLDDVGKRVDAVRVYGRGSRAHVCLLLDDGDRIVLDPLGGCSTPAKMMLELASQAGATPALKGPDVIRAVKLFWLLGEHYESADIASRAWELGAEYLRTAAIGEVDMDDQEARWAAFVTLDRADRNHGKVVLVDRAGTRYVRAKWFADYLRAHSSPGEPAAMTAELERSGWRKPGREGRIKATRPGLGGELIWAFHLVPNGWEQT